MKPILNSRQQKVWNKTDGRCWYCGCQLEAWTNAKDSLRNVFCIDHAIPIDKGGSNRIENLLPACWSCNSGKKKGKTVEEYRVHLGYKEIGAPIFTAEQREWLGKNGITIPSPAPIVFWGETNDCT